MKSTFQKQIWRQQLCQEHPLPEKLLMTAVSENPEMAVALADQWQKEADSRRQLVRDWRRARKALRRYDGQVKAELQRHWRKNPQQADNPRHLISLIHRYDNGNLEVKTHG